jgi:hypothetical protein
MDCCNEAEVLNCSDRCNEDSKRNRVINYVGILDLGFGENDDVIKINRKERRPSQF